MIALPNPTKELTMPVLDAGLVVAANALRAAITHAQLHSADPGAAGTTAAVGSRVAVGTGSTDADGDITFSNVAFTGLSANQAVSHVSFWSASTGGTCYATSATTGDTAANAAGAITATSLVINFA